MSALISASLPQVPSSRVLDRVGSRITYRGAGYLYHFRKAAGDTTAKLKIAKRVLELFVRRVGHVNTVGLKGLTVAEQGGGWYEIFTIEPHLQQAVVNFLKRLNQWMLRAIAPTACNHHDHPRPQVRHYNLTVTLHPIKNKGQTAPTFNAVHGLQPAQASAPCSQSKLLDMVAKVNSRFGH